MQPLLITSLVALLIALIKLRSTSAELLDAEYWRDFYSQNLVVWRNSCHSWRSQYDAQVNLVNKLQVDNALLVAALKRKHLRVPKL